MLISLGFTGLSSLGCRWLAVVLLALFISAVSGCVSVPAESPAARPEVKTNLSQEQIIAAGLAEAKARMRTADTPRPYANVYSTLGGLRPVKFNNNSRQVSDSDTDLLIQSIRALSAEADLKAFAIHGLARDIDGKLWFVVHYEERGAGAEMRQYPMPVPDDVSLWQPVVVEPAQPLVF